MTTLILAPMQGLVDDIMRDVLTRIGGLDECVSEFVRVTHTVHSRAVWLKYVPELAHGQKTRAGVPCVVQLLGSDEAMLLENARQAIDCGAKRIDLNFGCPAPTVNRHQGGAILLREPEKIYRIVSHLRQNLPDGIELSAKMRLGYEDANQALDCARAIDRAQAQRLAVHARTKIQGYEPPAEWRWIARIVQAVTVPVIANGDIFSVADFERARDVTGCEAFMLGRGAVQTPDLARQIALGAPAQTWNQILPWIAEFFTLCCKKEARNTYAVARLKQWLAMLKRQYPEAGALFEAIRTLRSPMEIAPFLGLPAFRLPESISVQ